MRTVIATLGAVLALVFIAGLGLIFSGFYHIEANAPHWGITNWILETIRDRSIKAHAAGIEAPPGLDDPATLVAGTEHFAAHCAICHGGRASQRAKLHMGSTRNLQIWRVRPSVTRWRSCSGS